MKGPYHKDMAFKNVGKSGMNEEPYKKIKNTSKSKEKGGWSLSIEKGPSSTEKDKTVIK